MNIPYQLDAFLAYWLSFLFLSPPEIICILSSSDGSVASSGKKFALALVYLGALYERPDECSNSITWSLSRYDMVCYADTKFFLWKRFREVSSMPREFKTVKLQLLDGSRG